MAAGRLEGNASRTSSVRVPSARRIRASAPSRATTAVPSVSGQPSSIAAASGLFPKSFAAGSSFSSTGGFGSLVAEGSCRALFAEDGTCGGCGRGVGTGTGTTRPPGNGEPPNVVGRVVGAGVGTSCAFTSGGAPPRRATLPSARSSYQASARPPSKPPIATPSPETATCFASIGRSSVRHVAPASNVATTPRRSATTAARHPSTAA